jgi:hypothetical protein
MKRNILGILSVVLILFSCQERNPGHFIDLSGVYFNNTTGMMTVADSTDLTFVYEAEDELEVPVKVQLIGRPAEYDRPLEIRMYSENAQEGVDYILPAQAVLPAGASEMDYVVTLKRTPALKNEKKMVHLQIHPNEHFALPVTHIVQVGDSVSVLDYRIYFSDMFTSAPAAWDANLLGEFTQQKFELICKVLDIDPGDFNDPSLMTLAKQLYISAEMTAYVRGEAGKKEAGKPYDADAFDPQTGEPLSFTK